MVMKLDHLLWGTPDLDQGVDAFAKLTGAQAVVGGTHPGFGTRNRLHALGPDVFFEIIAPDPAQTIPTVGRAADVAAMPHPGLLTFAVQTDNLDAACAAAEAVGLGVVERVAMHRTRPDGVRLDWEIARFAHPTYGNLIPFAIDWRGSPHPATSTPGGCTLRHLAALHPDPAPLAAIYRGLGLDIPVQSALRPGLVAVLGTPAGEACLLSV